MARKKSDKADFLARCSVCDSDLDPSLTIILEEGEQKTTAHVTCPNCSSASIVFLSDNQAGLLSVGVATDLDSSEVRDKFRIGPISADEIIDLHQISSGKGVDVIDFINNRSGN